MHEGQITIDQAEQLEQAGKVRQITSKYLQGNEKTQVVYDTVREAADDADRYGAIWLTIDGQPGFVQLATADGKPI